MHSWVEDIVSAVCDPVALQPGKRYLHPEDGPIRIMSGAFYRNGRVSNHWTWLVENTGETNHGYGENWPEY